MASDSKVDGPLTLIVTGNADEAAKYINHGYILSNICLTGDAVAFALYWPTKLIKIESDIARLTALIENKNNFTSKEK